MRYRVLPATAGHAAHALHTVVVRLEAVAHTTYLGMVSVGSHDYHLAAAGMLVTVLLGGLLHIIIAVSHE